MKEELHKKHPTQLNMCVSSDWPTIVIKKIEFVRKRIWDMPMGNFQTSGTLHN